MDVQTQKVEVPARNRSCCNLWQAGEKYFVVDFSVKYYLFVNTGLVVGAIIRYTGPITEPRVIPVVPALGTHYNHSVPPDVLWLQLSKRVSSKASATYLNNHTFVYTFRGEIDNTSLNEIDQKVQISPCSNEMLV